MTSLRDLAAPPPDISTRAEWLKLRQQRAAPKYELTLTPHDHDMEIIKAQSASMVESRIDFLRQSLDRSQNKLEHDHVNSRFDGYLRAQFGRGR